MRDVLESLFVFTLSLLLSPVLGSASIREVLGARPVDVAVRLEFRIRGVGVFGHRGILRSLGFEVVHEVVIFEVFERNEISLHLRKHVD